jgi:ribosomal protein L32
MSSTKNDFKKGKLLVNSLNDENDELKHDICPECPSTDIITDYIRSEKVCSNCGFILEERMINSALSIKYYNNINKQ